MNIKKPVTVPKEAIWREEDNEWELVIKNKNEGNVEKKWWLAPNGHLCCHTFFDEKDNMISAKRYHPNGEVSLELSFNENGEEVSIYHKSTADTNEYFPDGGFKNIWTAKKKVGVSPRDYNYYDKNGKLLTLDLGNELDEVKEGKPKETASESIERFKIFLDLVRNSGQLDEEILDELNYGYQPTCIKKVENDQLIELENQFGFKLPPSYKRFVLKEGLISFGEGNDERQMFLNFSRLSSAFAYWDVDADQFPKEEKAYLDNLITFSYGDEGLQLVWYHCFDYNSLNPQTGEVNIMDFDQDEIYYIGKQKSNRCVDNGFDTHIQSLVNDFIQEILNEYC